MTRESVASGYRRDADHGACRLARLEFSVNWFNMIEFTVTWFLGHLTS